MKPYFDHYESYQALIAWITRWLDASYLHGAYKPYTSVDCVHFVGDILIQTGVVTGFLEMPKYPENWYTLGSDEIPRLLEEHLVNVPGDELAAWERKSTYLAAREGDLLLYKIKSEVVNHVAIQLLGRKIAHASTRAKKVIIESNEAFEKFCVGSYALYRSEE